MGAIADKNVADVKEMKKLRAAALKKLEPAIAAMDIAVWNRAIGKIVGETGDDLMGLLQDADKLLRSNVLRDARKGLQPLSCRHLMACFPEVFLRKNSGFDVLLGNPPWEKVKFEERMFYARYISGYYAMSELQQEEAVEALNAASPESAGKIAEVKETAEKEAKILGQLYSDPPGRFRYGKSSGDPDLFRMFTWRYWNLVSEGGRIGIVLPLTAFTGDGLTEWRLGLMSPQPEDPESSKAELALTVLTNKDEWVFDDIHQQSNICLCSIKKIVSRNEVQLNGPFFSLDEFRLNSNSYITIPPKEILGWTDSAKMPALPSPEALSIFRKLRLNPDVVGSYDIRSEWYCRPYAELHATGDKHLFSRDLKQRPSEDSLPVYKGESFDLWNGDTGLYYGWTYSREKALKELYANRLSSYRRKGKSVFSQYSEDVVSDEKTLECLSPRIAFRNVTNRTNTRTVIVALLPPEVVCTHGALVLLWPQGNDHDRAYVLGILSSRVLDWYSRRWVEKNLTYSIFNYLPCPRVSGQNPLYRELVSASGRLACPDKRFVQWAKAVGVECGTLKPEEKQELIDRVDATAALLYGLSEQELETVFETFHEGWDWKPDHARVLAEYRRLKAKHKI
jgi:hypothetical protein